jgi:hypothetical protein
MFTSAEFVVCWQFSNAGAAGWVRKFQAVVNWRKWIAACEQLAS